MFCSCITFAHAHYDISAKRFVYINHFKFIGCVNIKLARPYSISDTTVEYYLPNLILCVYISKDRRSFITFFSLNYNMPK